MPVYGHMSFSTDPRYVIHEAYVGKTPTLLEAEKQINKIRVNCKKFTDINKSPEVQALNRLIEKQFGMDVFAILVEQNNIPEAHTIPIDTRFDVGLKHDISDFVIGDKKTGYKFKPDNGLGIIFIVSLGILKSPDFTDGEILAIMLHEIGHNFSGAIYNDIKIANKKWVTDYYNYLIQNTTNKKIIDKTMDKNSSSQVIRQSKEKPKGSTGFKSGVSGTFKDIGRFFKDLFGKLGPGSSIARSLLYKIDTEKIKKDTMNSVERRDEVIADKFAGVYGYGPEQVSALFKLDKYMTAGTKFVGKIPLIGKLRLATFYKNNNAFYIFDEHPTDVQRAYEEIKLLEAELEKSDVDPKLRKVIKSQIKQIEDQIKEAMKISEDADAVEKVRAAFYAYINDNDKDALPKNIEKEINDALDKALESGGKK